VYVVYIHACPERVRIGMSNAYPEHVRV